jgi:hypothetical protein
MGIVIILILFCISVLTFLAKSISGKPDFKKELLTGGLCGIPMIILVVYMSLFGASAAMSMLDISNFGRAGFLTFLIMMYVLLMMINIVQQSLRSVQTKDALNWYLSPVIVCLSFYLGSVFANAIF